MPKRSMYGRSGPRTWSAWSCTAGRPVRTTSATSGHSPRPMRRPRTTSSSMPVWARPTSTSPRSSSRNRPAMSEPSSRAASPVTRYSRVSRSSTEAIAAARSTRLRSRAEVTRARDRSRVRSTVIASARARAVTSAVVSRAMISTRVGRPLGWGSREKVMEKKRGRPGSHQSRGASSTDTARPVAATSRTWSSNLAAPAWGNTSPSSVPTIRTPGARERATSLASSMTRSGARTTATASGLRSTRAATRSRSSRSSRRIVSSRPTSRKLIQAPRSPPARSIGPPAQRTRRATPSWPTNWTWRSLTRSPARTSKPGRSSCQVAGTWSVPAKPQIRTASALAYRIRPEAWTTATPSASWPRTALRVSAPTWSTGAGPGGGRSPRASTAAVCPTARRPAMLGPPVPDATALALDGDADQAAPLGPGAVVVADVRVAEQFVQHEPGVGAALADPAVGDHVLAGLDALGAVQLGQLAVAEELAGGAVDRLGPGDVDRAGDVARPLGGLLGQVVGGELLAPVLLGRADVDQRGAVAAADRVQHLLAEGPDRGVGLAHRVAAARRDVGRFAGQLAALQLPGLAAAVEQLDRAVPVDLVVPVGVGGEPVVVAPVQDHGRVRGDAEGVLELGELLGRDEVAAQRVLEVGVPVDGHGPADVPAGIRVGVLVDLDHAQVGVVQVGGQPVGRDQQLITVGHGYGCLLGQHVSVVRKRPRLGSGPVGQASGAATRRHGGRPAAEFPVPSPIGAQARVVSAAGPRRTPTGSTPGWAISTIMVVQAASGAGTSSTNRSSKESRWLSFQQTATRWSWSTCSATSAL